MIVLDASALLAFMFIAAFPTRRVCKPESGSHLHRDNRVKPFLFRFEDDNLDLSPRPSSNKSVRLLKLLDIILII